MQDTFLLTLYKFKNIGGAPPPALRSLKPVLIFSWMFKWYRSFHLKILRRTDISPIPAIFFHVNDKMHISLPLRGGHWDLYM